MLSHNLKILLIFNMLITHSGDNSIILLNLNTTILRHKKIIVITSLRYNDFNMESRDKIRKSGYALVIKDGKTKVLKNRYD